MFSKGIE